MPVLLRYTLRYISSIVIQDSIPTIEYSRAAGSSAIIRFLPFYIIGNIV